MSKKFKRFAYVTDTRIYFNDNLVVPTDNCLVYEYRNGHYVAFFSVLVQEVK